MCQRRETDMANTVVSSLLRENEIKAQLKNCEAREKQLNFKLQQYEEGSIKIVQDLQNQIKEVSSNLSNCRDALQQCKTQGEKIESDKQKLQESLKQCTQSVQQLTMGQETIIRLLGESKEELKREIFTTKSSLPLVHLATGHYLFLNKVMNWTDARKFCKSNGMDLVAIESEAENTAIYNHAKNLPGWYDAWTSGCYSTSRGAHVWESTGKNVTYFNWAPLEPTRRADGNCILTTNFSALWWDQSLSINQPNRVVCEL